MSVRYLVSGVTFSFILFHSLINPDPRHFFGQAIDQVKAQPHEQKTALPNRGESIDRELSAGAVHRYETQLKRSSYFQAVLEVRGGSGSFSFVAPSGQSLIADDFRDNSQIPITFITEIPGAYFLEIRSTEQTASAQYNFRVEEIRDVSEKDRQRVIACQLLREGDLFLWQWKEGGVRNGIDSFKQALQMFREVGDQQAIVRTLVKIGDAYQILSEYKSAAEEYDEARSIAHSCASCRAEVLNDLGYVYLNLGDNLRAFNLFSDARKIFEALSNRSGIARALNNLGEATYGLGSLQQSLEYYQQALPYWKEASDRQGQALTLLNFGYTYSDLGQMDNALSYYQQALTLWKASNNHRGQAITLTAIGRLYSRMGESQQALNSFDLAMEMIQPLGALAEQGRILTGQGYVYEQMGDKNKALDYYAQAFELFRSTGDYSGEVASLYDTGRINHALGNYEKALADYQKALLTSIAAHDRRLQSFELREIGRVYESWGDPTKALKNYLKALNFWRSESDSRAAAETLNLIGNLYERSGGTQKSLVCYKQALDLSRKAQFRAGEAASLFNLALGQRNQGDLTQAKARIEEALKIVESLRSKVTSQDLRASYFASVREHYDLYIDVLMRLHKEHPNQGYDIAAFDVSERARARSLLELLDEARADIRRDVDKSLIDQEDSLQQELDAAAERQTKRTAMHDSRGAQDAEREIDRLTTELERIRTQIREQSPRYAALTQTAPIQLREIQDRLLDDQTVLLEYALGNDRSYMWAVTRSKVLTFELPPRSEIEAAVIRFHRVLTANQPQPDQSYQDRNTRLDHLKEEFSKENQLLSTLLIGAVANELADKRLLIVPDGALQYIPFQTLTVDSKLRDSPSNSETLHHRKPLLASHEIINEPSASTLALLASTGNNRPLENTVAMLADPVFEADDPRIKTRQVRPSEETNSERNEVQRAFRDLDPAVNGRRIPRLLASREEAEAIVALVPRGTALKALGFDATRAAVMKPELGTYRIVHFATHGLLNNEHPQLSGIVLSLFDEQGQPQNGFLRLHDIYSLKLPVDLVVLSSCNSGLGKDVRGEGLIGLTRGFMYAGASAVVSSLWKVDDEATAELMKQFYRGMFEQRLTPPAALRRAQLSMSTHERWSAPYYWAGFVIQGQYNQNIYVNDRTRIFSAGLWITAVVTVSLVAFLLIWHRRKHLVRNSIR